MKNFAAECQRVVMGSEGIGVFVLVFAAGLVTALACVAVFGRKVLRWSRRALKMRKTALVVQALLASVEAEGAATKAHLAEVWETLKEARTALSGILAQDGLEETKLDAAEEAEIQALVAAAKGKAKKAREEAQAREDERAGIRAVLDSGLDREKKVKHQPLNASLSEKLEGAQGDARYKPKGGTELPGAARLEASIAKVRSEQQKMAQAGQVARKTGPLNGTQSPFQEAQGAKPKADWDDVARQFSAGMDKVLSESGLNGSKLNSIAKKVSSPFFRAQIPAEHWIKWGLRARKKGAYEAAALLFDKATVSGKDLQAVRQALYLSGELRISKGIDPVKGINRIRKLLELGGDDAWTEAAKKMVVSIGGR